MKKKLLYPLRMIGGYCLCLLVMLLLSAANDFWKGDTGYGGAVIMFGILAAFCVIVIPLHCVLYSRKVLLGEKHGWLFVPYNALWTVLPFMLVFFADEETYLYAVGVFAWATLWTAIPLLFPAKKKVSSATVA